MMRDGVVGQSWNDRVERHNWDCVQARELMDKCPDKPMGTVTNTDDQSTTSSGSERTSLGGHSSAGGVSLDSGGADRSRGDELGARERVRARRPALQGSTARKEGERNTQEKLG